MRSVRPMFLGNMRACWSFVEIGQHGRARLTTVGRRIEWRDWFGNKCAWRCYNNWLLDWVGRYRRRVNAGIAIVRCIDRNGSQGIYWTTALLGGFPSLGHFTCFHIADGHITGESLSVLYFSSFAFSLHTWYILIVSLFAKLKYYRQFCSVSVTHYIDIFHVCCNHTHYPLGIYYNYLCIYVLITHIRK